jgi:type II secretory ATPase GspE/PulE/Tfp pilus assembly ATPase PilB-like protein
VLSIGQRLVPVLCEDSKKAMPIEDSMRMMIEEQFADLPVDSRSSVPEATTVYHAEKTATCPSGTKGRLAVFEFLTMDKGLETLVLKNPGENEIYKYARERGFISMKEDAIIKSLKGLIPFEEVNKL